MYIDTPVQLLSMVSATAACAYALWRGGPPERTVASALAFAWYATPFLENRQNIAHTQTAVFALDAALTGLIVIVAMKSDRFWPLLLAAFQILEVLMHVSMVADSKVHARAYFVGIEIWSYLVLATLALGTWLEAHKSRPGRARPVRLTHDPG